MLFSGYIFILSLQKSQKKTYAEKKEYLILKRVVNPLVSFAHCALNQVKKYPFISQPSSKIEKSWGEQQVRKVEVRTELTIVFHKEGKNKHALFPPV